MKKLTVTFLVLLLAPSLVVAADFAPTKLELTMPEVINYDFDGSTLEIPVTVTGTPARTWVFVFTKGKGDVIGEVQNGYLGWHYVNGIDTCVFMSASSDFEPGDNTITWAGVDSDGGAVPADDGGDGLLLRGAGGEAVLVGGHPGTAVPGIGVCFRPQSVDPAGADPAALHQVRRWKRGHSEARHDRRLRHGDQPVLRAHGTVHRAL